MNTGTDPEETQAAPTEILVTPPTELAFENQPTIFSPPCPAEEPLPYWPYVPEPPPAPAALTQGQPGQEAKQTNETSPLSAAFSYAGGGLFFSVSISKEVILYLLLFVALICAVWIYCHYASKGALASVPLPNQ